MSDYKVLVSFSEDEMEGYVTIVPYRDERRGYIETERELIQQLKKEGIVYGIMEDKVKEAMELYNFGKDVKNFLIAVGKPVENGVDGKVELKVDLSTQPKIEGNKIDYKELDKFKVVEKGELIAIKTKARKGKRGITVTGLGKEPKEGETVILFPGKNVKTEEKEDAIYFYAEETGYVVYQKDRIAVFPMLSITGDVDYSVGNIHYNGDVKIMGDVLPDFVVEATGKVIIYGTAISCTIKSDSDVIIKGGVAGKDKGKIIAKGDVDIGYIERGFIYTEGDVYVKGGVLDGKVVCGGTFYGELRTVKVMESEIKASKGINVFVAGSPYNKELTLITGVDVLKEKEVEKFREELALFVKEFGEIKRKYGEDNLEKKNMSAFLGSLHTKGKVEEDFGRYFELKDIIKGKYEKLKRLEEGVYEINAMIKVKNTIYPGVKLQIGQYNLVVPKKLHNVIFYKDKESEEIKWTVDLK